MLAWVNKTETISGLLRYLIMDPAVAPKMTIETPDPYESRH